MSCISLMASTIAIGTAMTQAIMMTITTTIYIFNVFHRPMSLFALGRIVAAMQTDKIALTTEGLNGIVNMDLVASRFSHSALRVRELAKFMDSEAYLKVIGSP